jgi:hypothetical protein
VQALIFPDRLEQLPLRSQQRLESRVLGCQLRGESVATSASAGDFGFQGTARHGGEGSTHWVVSHKFDRRGAELADGHYSRRTVGSPQFMPPGQTLILVARDGASLFGWWRPHPRSGIKAMNGLDGWTCTIFRRTGGARASDMILEAETILSARQSCGPSGLLTYVWDAKVSSANPGFCFKRAGWHVAGNAYCCVEMRPRSADGKKTLLHKPFALAGKP